MNRRDVIKLLSIVAVLVLAVVLVNRIDTAHGTAETEIVRDAVKNAALTCYAVEGAYPENVDYLREYYRLAYDENRYFVTYESFASNMLPDIWVTEADLTDDARDDWFTAGTDGAAAQDAQFDDGSLWDDEADMDDEAPDSQETEGEADFE